MKLNEFEALKHWSVEPKNKKEKGEDGDALAVEESQPAAKNVAFGDYLVEGKPDLVECDTVEDLARYFSAILIKSEFKADPKLLIDNGETASSHLVNLASSFKGSFYLKPSANLDHAPVDGVSEADYPREYTVYKNAAYISWSPLIIGVLLFRGEKTLVFEAIKFLQHEGDDLVDQFVDLVAKKSGRKNEDVKVLVETILAIEPVVDMDGAQQIFVPLKEGGYRLLSVVTPFALPITILRSRAGIVEAFKQEKTKEAEEAAAAAQEEVDAKDKKGKKGRPEKLSVPGLYLPRFALPIGGTKPQNIGARFGSVHQTAVIFNDVPSLKARHQLSNKTFYKAALLREVRLHAVALPKKWETLVGLPAAQRRQRLEAVVLEVLSSLLELKTLWSEQEVQDAQHLSKLGLGNILKSSEPWALFVKGAPDASSHRDSVEALSKDVVRLAKVSLAKHFQEDVVHDLDDELMAVASRIIQIEHAPVNKNDAQKETN